MLVRVPLAPGPAELDSGDRPLSQTKIGLMLAEVDVFSRSFEITRDGQRHQMQVYDLADLERVWSERRSSS